MKGSLFGTALKTLTSARNKNWIISWKGDLFLISTALELQQCLRCQTLQSAASWYLRDLGQDYPAQRSPVKSQAYKDTSAASDLCFFPDVQARLENENLKEQLCQLLSLNFSTPW